MYMFRLKCKVWDAASHDKSGILFGKIFQYTGKEFATLPTPLNLPMCLFIPLTDSIFRSALSWPNLKHIYKFYIYIYISNVFFFFTKCVATEGSNLSSSVKVDKPLWKYFFYPVLMIYTRQNKLRVTSRSKQCNSIFNNMLGLFPISDCYNNLTDDTLGSDEQFSVKIFFSKSFIFEISKILIFNPKSLNFSS